MPKLTRPWNSVPAGTEVQRLGPGFDPRELPEGGIAVDPQRFEQLTTEGFFAAEKAPRARRDAPVAAVEEPTAPEIAKEVAEVADGE